MAFGAARTAPFDSAKLRHLSLRLTVVGRPPNCSLGIPHLRVVIHTANPSSAGIISAMPMTVTHEPILF
jgi:hypothetical protein